MPRRVASDWPVTKTVIMKLWAQLACPRPLWAGSRSLILPRPSYRCPGQGQAPSRSIARGKRSKLQPAAPRTCPLAEGLEGLLPAKQLVRNSWTCYSALESPRSATYMIQPNSPSPDAHDDVGDGSRDAYADAASATTLSMEEGRLVMAFNSSWSECKREPAQVSLKNAHTQPPHMWTWPVLKSKAAMSCIM